MNGDFNFMNMVIKGIAVLIVAVLMVSAIAYIQVPSGTDDSPTDNDSFPKAFGPEFIRISSDYDTDSSTTSGIQEALDSLSASGGILFIPAGTQDISDTIIIPSSNIIIRGVGSATVLSASSLAGDFFYFTDKNNILIENLDIDGTDQSGGNGINADGASYRCNYKNIHFSNVFGLNITGEISGDFDGDDIRISTEFDSASSLTAGIQEALDALPATGGTIFVPTGDYPMTDQVARAIDNVCIMGVGVGTKIRLDGHRPVITAGVQNGWVFKDFQTDAGGVDRGVHQNRIDNLWKEGAKVEDLQYDCPYLMPVADATGARSHDVAIKDGIAYGTGYADDTFVVVDIKDPKNPVLLAEVVDAVHFDGIHDIVIDGDYAYVTNIHRDSVCSIDISDPTAPVFVSEAMDTDALRETHALMKEGDYIYAGGIAVDGVFTVIDASDPTNLAIIGTATDPMTWNIRGIEKVGDNCFCANTSGKLLVVDVSDPENPVQVASLQVTPNTGGVMLVNIRIRGDFAYITSDDHGIFVIDISDPLIPVEVGFVGLKHCNYLEIQDETLYVSVLGFGGMPDAVVVVDISDPTNPKVLSTYIAPSGEMDFPSGMRIFGKYLLVTSRDTVDCPFRILRISNGGVRSSDEFLDVLAEDVDYVLAATAGDETYKEVTAGLTNPDVPRNVTITTTNNAAPTGDVCVTGRDAKGNLRTDHITVNPAGIRYGSVAFSTVVHVIIPDGVAAGDTVAVGIGSSLGLCNNIHVDEDVYKVKKSNADYSGAGNVTVDEVYSTVDVSTGGAIGGGDDFTIYYVTKLQTLGD